MENFFTLRAEKQEHIIHAALTVFGRTGYKKTSIACIAEEAGIAKGMVIYYFGSKKNLYLYLMEFCGNEIVTAMKNNFDENVTDFFDRIKMITDIKISLIKKHSALFSFFTSIYYETDPEVCGEIKEYIARSAAIREQWMHQEADTSRFKDDVDPKLLDRFLTWAGEGFAFKMEDIKEIEKIEAFTNEMYACLNLMKKYFYKE